MVETEQQGVVDGAGLEVGLEVVVHGELADVFLDDAGGTADGAVGQDRLVRACWPDHAAGGDALEVQLVAGVAQVLAELPHVVEAGLEGIAQRVVGAVVGFPVRITEVLVVGDLARGAGQLGALQWQELTGDAGIVAGELRDEGQLGVVVDVPGHAWRQVVALVRNVVDRRAAVTHGTAQAIEELALVVDLAGAVEVDLLVFVAADLDFDLVAVLGLWAAGDHVHQAAGRGLAVDGGGRAAQHGDALQVPGFDLRRGVVAAWQRQAIEELGRLETAHQQPVAARVGAVAAALHAGGIAQGVVEVEHRTVFHLLAGDHGQRARQFGDGGVGLAAGGGAGGGVAFHRAPGAFIGAGGVDAGFRQGEAAFRGGDQAVGAGAALLQLQAGAAQCLLQRADRVELAVDRRRGAPVGQGRVQGQGDTGLAGDLVQGAGQRGGRQVVAARFGGDQLGAGQGRGDGDGHGQQAWAQEAFD